MTVIDDILYSPIRITPSSHQQIVEDLRKQIADPIIKEVRFSIDPAVPFRIYHQIHDFLIVSGRNNRYDPTFYTQQFTRPCTALDLFDLLRLVHSGTTVVYFAFETSNSRVFQGVCQIGEIVLKPFNNGQFFAPALLACIPARTASYYLYPWWCLGIVPYRHPTYLSGLLFETEQDGRDWTN